MPETLYTLRSQFYKESGRNDLSTPQVDTYLNKAIELLDRESNFQQSAASQFILAPINTSQVNFASACRSLEEVWCIDSINGKTKLTAKPYSELMAEPLSTSDPAVPLYYCPRVVRIHPVSFDLTNPAYAGYLSYIDALSASTDIKGILISPATDKEYLIEVIGRFLSPLLDSSTIPPVTINWWTVNNPGAIINAAMYELYREYKNTEAMGHYTKALAPVITSLDHDEAEDESAGIERMEG